MIAALKSHARAFVPCRMKLRTASFAKHHVNATQSRLRCLFFHEIVSGGCLPDGGKACARACAKEREEESVFFYLSVVARDVTLFRGKPADGLETTIAKRGNHVREHGNIVE